MPRVHHPFGMFKRSFSESSKIKEEEEKQIIGVTFVLDQKDEAF